MRTRAYGIDPEFREVHKRTATSHDEDDSLCLRAGLHVSLPGASMTRHDRGIHKNIANCDDDYIQDSSRANSQRPGTFSDQNRPTYTQNNSISSDQASKQLPHSKTTATRYEIFNQNSVQRFSIHSSIPNVPKASPRAQIDPKNQ